MHKHCKLNVTSLRVHKMLQDIETTKCRKIVVLRSYQRGGNLKKGEVNFERGVQPPRKQYLLYYIIVHHEFISILFIGKGSST